jgi:geranylgeranyl pyrophosphate synthase
LFAGSAEMGAVIGGAPADDVRALRGYGADLGLAFQIVDDVLDLRQATGDLGKPAGNDLRQGTVTLPTMLYAAGLAAASPELKRLRAVISDHDDGDGAVETVVADIRSSGAIDEALRVAEEYVDRAKARLDIVPDADTAALLNDVADIALSRTA